MTNNRATDSTTGDKASIAGTEYKQMDREINTSSTPSKDGGMDNMLAGLVCDEVSPFLLKDEKETQTGLPMRQRPNVQRTVPVPEGQLGSLDKPFETNGKDLVTPSGPLSKPCTDC